MKKAIDWLALVVGVALALFGARWMWTGWDIVQAERGWAAVIAGSVMLSGGLIVAMLAWTIMRLSGAPAAERQAPPAQAEKPGLFRKPSIAAPAAIAAGAGAIAATAGAALARDAAPDEDAQTPPKDAAQEPLPSPLPPPLPPTAPPTVGELLRMSEDRAARDSHEKHFEEPEAAIAPPDEEPKAEPPAALETSVDEDDEDDDGNEDEGEEEAPEAESETHEPVAPATAEKPAPVLPPVPPLVEPSRKVSEPPSAPLRLPEPEPAAPRATTDEEPVYDDWLERTAREFDRELGRDALPKEEPPPAEEPAAPSKPEPAVVGRYSSGDTNYLMFADGSIEAQTPEGVMRFSSLTELKRFVEKRN